MLNGPTQGVIGLVSVRKQKEAICNHMPKFRTLSFLISRKLWFIFMANQNSVRYSVSPSYSPSVEVQNVIKAFLNTLRCL